MFDALSTQVGVEITKGLLNLQSAPAVPSIPSLGAGDVDSLRRVVGAVKGLLDVREGRAGSVLDKHLTLRDLMGSTGLFMPSDQGLIANATASTSSYTGYVDPRPILATPPTLTALTAQGAFKTVVATWTMTPYANHAYVEVWRTTAPSTALGTAVLNGTSTSNIYVDASGVVGASYYYWVRAFNIAGTAGAFNAVSGVSAALLQVAGTDLSALAVTADKLSVGTYSNINLVPNPGSEDGTVAWALVEGNVETFIADTSDKVSGSTSFKLTKAAASGTSAYGCHAIPVIPGETYSVKFKARGNVASAAGQYFRFNESATAPVVGYVTQLNRSSTTDLVGNGPVNLAWTKYEYTYVVPSGVYWVSFSMYCWSGSTNTSLWWDDVSVGRQITASSLAAGSIAVGTLAVQSGAIVNAMIGLLAVDTARIADGAINTAKIGNLAVDTAQIASAAVTTAKIANLAVNTAQIANLAVGTAQIGNAAVTNAQIGNLAVNTAQIANLAVGTAQIANLAVGTAQIGNAAVTNAQIGNLAVNTAQIASLAVGTLQIADLAISIPISGNWSGSTDYTTSTLSKDILYTAYYAMATGQVTAIVSYLLKALNATTTFRVVARLYEVGGTSVSLFDFTIGAAQDYSLTPTLAGNATVPFSGMWRITLDISNASSTGIIRLTNLNIVGLGTKK